MKADTPAKAARWTAQWKELFEEVITTGLCTGCAGCVVTCPHDVIGYQHEEGKYIPFHLEEELGRTTASTARRAARRAPGPPAVPELGAGGRRAPVRPGARARRDGGHLAPAAAHRASDKAQHQRPGRRVRVGDAGVADGARLHRGRAGVGRRGRRRVEGQAGAGPQPRRGAGHGGQPLHVLRQPAGPARRQGRGPQPPGPGRDGLPDQLAADMWDRKAGKVSKPFLFNIGLLCSKTFDDAIFPELFEAKYGLAKQDMVKMNIKGVFQIWMKDGSYHEIDLKECHQWTREGCKSCPDFAAEHADISTGGIGEDNDWTLTIVRTELGEEVINRMIADGTIIARPAQEDEKAMKLLRHAVDRVPPPLAQGRRPGAGDRRPAAEEEGRRRTGPARPPACREPGRRVSRRSCRLEVRRPRTPGTAPCRSTAFGRAEVDVRAAGGDGLQLVFVVAVELRRRMHVRWSSVRSAGTRSCPRPPCWRSGCWCRRRARQRRRRRRPGCAATLHESARLRPPPVPRVTDRRQSDVGSVVLA